LTATQAGPARAIRSAQAASAAAAARSRGSP
jgi:hypothetical protein